MADETISLQLAIDAATAATTIGGLKEAIRDLKSGALEAEAAGNEGLKRGFEEAAANAQGKVFLLNREMRELRDTGTKLGAVLRAGSVIAEGFSAATAATALFGVTNEETVKTIEKVQAAQALAGAATALASVGYELQGAKLVVLGVITRAYALVVGEATGAMRIFRLALAGTGIGLLVLALGELVAHWDEVKEAISGVSHEQELYNDINKKGIENSVEDTVRLNDLFNKAKDLNISYKERKDAVEKLQEQYPNYLKNLTVENANSEEIANTIRNKLIPAIQEKARVAVAEEKLTALIKKQNELAEETPTIWESATVAIKSQFESTGDAIADVAKKRTEDVKTLQTDIDNITKSIIKSNETIDKLGGDPGKQKKEKVDNKEAEYQKKILKEIEDARVEQIAENYDRERALAVKNYNEKLSEIKGDTANEIILKGLLQNELSTKLQEIDKKQEDETLKKQEEALKKEQEKQNGFDEQEITNIKSYYSAKQSLLTTQFNAGLINKRDYNTKLLKLDADELKSELDNANLSATQKLAIETQLNAKLKQLGEIQVQDSKDVGNAKKQFADETANALSAIDGLLQTNAQKNSAASKIIAETEILIKTAEAIANVIAGATAAAAAGGPAAPFLLAGYVASGIATVVNAMAQSSKLLGQAGGSVAISSSGINASAPNLLPPNAIQGTGQTTSLADNNANPMQNVRVYVVESDVTKAQKNVATIQQRAVIN